METALSDIGFAEFTTQLVVDVFDGLVTQNIRQMQAYLDLLEGLAKTDAVYVDEAQGDVDDSLIDALLVKALPDPDDAEGTLIKAGNVLSTTNISDLNDVIGLAAESGGLDETIAGDPMYLDANEVKVSGTVSDESKALTLTDLEVTLIREAAARRIASKQLSSLREMAKMGLMRLVVDSGTIETRLTFSMTTSSESTSTTSSVTSSAVSGSATGKWMKVSASVSASRVKVRTASSFNQDTSGSAVQVYGSVKINFKTDYIPLSG